MLGPVHLTLRPSGPQENQRPGLRAGCRSQGEFLIGSSDFRPPLPFYGSRKGPSLLPGTGRPLRIPSSGDPMRTWSFPSREPARASLRQIWMIMRKEAGMFLRERRADLEVCVPWSGEGSLSARGLLPLPAQELPASQGWGCEEDPSTASHCPGVRGLLGRGLPSSHGSSEARALQSGPHLVPRHPWCPLPVARASAGPLEGTCVPRHWLVLL